MGQYCGSAAASSRKETAQAPKSVQLGPLEEKLLDTYCLGRVLGQGAFGVVYACRKRGTNDDFAVKMVDQVETPIAAIKQEVYMLKKLAHPCVVKLHDVYYEKVFVCMVMDCLKGGDMIEGMQLHWKAKGMIPIKVCQNVSKMMFQSIAWLHQNKCVHRDIKGDNYLQDRKELEHPNCRIYLSDFGTVCELPEAGRIHVKCGTKTYWSPEFFSLDYSLKADVWALGVTVFGLVSGRFPFKGEDDVRTKPVKVPTRCGTECSSFLLGCLERDEEKRLAAAEAVEHEFLSSTVSAAEHEINEKEEFRPTVREAGANAGVKERRRELVARLEQAKEGKSNMKTSVKELEDGFENQLDGTETKRKYEWWDKQKCNESKLLDILEKAVPSKDSDREEKDAVRTTLQDHAIDPTQFGVGVSKTFTEFVDEVKTGSARLMIDASRHKCLVRVVDIVLLRIVTGTGANKKYLVKYQEETPDGRTRRTVPELTGTKKLPHENGIETAHRLIKERMSVLEGMVQFDFRNKECFEDDEESPSYPGVRTVYRKEIYEGNIRAQDKDGWAKLGLGTGLQGTFKTQDASQYIRHFAWMSSNVCKAKKVRLTAPKEEKAFSALVHPPVGYEEEELQGFLKDNNVDVSLFGQNGVKTLADFSEELVKGEAALQRMQDGSIRRIVDVVIVRMMKANGDVLVEASETTGDKTKELKRLPAVKRRADENPFLAAHRVVDKVLRINENVISMDQNILAVSEETSSSAYANLPTIYHKRIVTVRLVDAAQ